MARIRTIKPEFPSSETIGRLSRDARLCFIQIWTFVDDEGRARGASRLLASHLYPYDDDAPALIEHWLAELEQHGCIRRYEVEGTTYLDIPNWLKHQKIDKSTKSKLPAFVETSRALSTPRESSLPEYRSKTLDHGPRTRDQNLAEGKVSGGTSHAQAPTREDGASLPDEAFRPPAPAAWTDDAPFGRGAAAGGAR